MPPSSTNRRIQAAADIYQQFTGHDADYYEKIEYNPIDVGAKIGHVDGIMYTTVRDGKTEHYIHEFKKTSRPLLVSDHDGSKIQLIEGKYRFTDRGIIDD